MPPNKKVGANRLAQMQQKGAVVTKPKPGRKAPAPAPEPEPAPPPAPAPVNEDAINRTLQMMLESNRDVAKGLASLKPESRPGRVKVKVSNLARDRNKRLESFELDFNFLD